MNKINIWCLSNGRIYVDRRIKGRPKDKGGLGIKNLQWQNEALGAKLIWCLYKERDHKWANIFYNKYLNLDDPLSILRMKNLPRRFESWNFMTKCHHLVCKFLT